MLVTVLFVSAVTFAQEGHEDNDDSLKVVVPSQENADLNMLVPPQSFVVSEAFNGYISFQTSSAIIMTMINDAVYVKIAEGMTEEFYAQNKLTYISDSKIETDHGFKGRMFKLTFELEGDQWIRYMVYIGDLENTLWLNITYPKLVEELVEEEILKSIQSVNLNPSTDEIEK